MNIEEKEILINDVLDRLQEKAKSTWHKHPLTLVVVSFILTTILGTIISSSMGTMELKSKQAVLYKEKMLERKLALIAELNNDLGSTLAEVENLVHHAFIYSDSVEFSRGKTSYSKAILGWKAKSKATQANLSIYFGSAVWDEFGAIDSAFFFPNESSIYINGINVVTFSYADLTSRREDLEKFCGQMMQTRNYINKHIRTMTELMAADMFQSHSEMMQIDEKTNP